MPSNAADGPARGPAAVEKPGAPHTWDRRCFYQGLEQSSEARTAPCLLRSSPLAKTRGPEWEQEEDALADLCVLAASPRRGGVCERAAQAVASAAREAGARVRELSLASLDLQGCVGCGACAHTGACRFDARELAAAVPVPQDAPATAAGLIAALRGADALVVVAPLYFAGPPSQLKALLDRMQPWWAQRYLLGANPPLPPGRRKPWGLVCAGGGGDPFGREPLVTSCRSALRMLDFELAGPVCDLVGRAQGPEGFSAVRAEVEAWARTFVAGPPAADAPATPGASPFVPAPDEGFSVPVPPDVCTRSTSKESLS